MSTVDRPGRKVLPPLVEGQELDRETFHQRYAAMPPETRAELIGGIVSMASPLGYDHGDRDGDVSDWLGYYKAYTKGLLKALNATTQFDDYGEVQPDSQLRIPEELGGLSRHVGGYIAGPPELVVEVGKSSRFKDLGPKKADYERAGVPEYVFVGIDPDEVRWFALRDGRYGELTPDAEGILRSAIFPGLWLDPKALLEGDMERVFAVVDLGLASPEHAAFTARLAGGMPR